MCVVFSGKSPFVLCGELFTNCTLEYTLTMLDTTFREVTMENKERDRIQNGKGESSGHLGEKE